MSLRWYAFLCAVLFTIDHLKSISFFLSKCTSRLANKRIHIKLVSSESSAAGRETWVNVFAAVPVGSSPTICSVPAMCMHDGSYNGHRSNYVYMIDCTWSLLHTIQAEWLHIILPARLGFIYISYSENLSRLLFIFQTANPKVHYLPYLAVALSRNFCNTYSVSHIYTQTSCSYLYLVE